MDIQTAKSAAVIAAQIEKLADTIARIDTAIAEGWLITQLKVAAPAEGSSQPAGTLLDLLPFGGNASADDSKAALERARATYQGALDALTVQLAGL